MKTTLSHSSIEPLEQRIAPALLVNGANLLGGSSPHTGETSTGDNALVLVKVLSGQAIVWYDGTQNHIVGISVGPGANLDITGNVYGDIVANLDSTGHLSDTDSNPVNGRDGGVLLPNNVLGIVTHPLTAENGDIGHIVTGGSISNVKINGQINGIYAGDGVFRSDSNEFVNTPSGKTVEVNIGLPVDPILASHQTGFELLQTAALPLGGASISNVTIQSANGLQLFAGNGASYPANLVAGGVGGSVSNITLISASPGYYIHAGDGGDGKSGGAGGFINKVVEKSSGGLVKIVAGAGGNGLANVGAGGAGGSITGVDAQSDTSQYTVTAGTGGTGISGGVGGSLINNNFAGKTPNTGIIVSSDFTGDGEGDLLFIDSGTGTMVISKNNGSGVSFTTVIQDPGSNNNPFIAAVGTGTSSAVAADVNGDGFTDIVVSYKNSNSVGVFLNDGHGIFTPANTKVLALSDSPSKVVVGNFSGSNVPDLAILTTNSLGSNVTVAVGDGTGTFVPEIATTTFKEPSASDFQTARVDFNSFDDLFVGFQSGRVETLLASNDSKAPFSVVDNGVVMAYPITNMDVDQVGGNLLLFSAFAPNPVVTTVTSPATLTTPAVTTTSTGPSFAIELMHFSPSGHLSLTAYPDLSSLPGHPTIAHYLHDNLTGPSSVVVLSDSTGGSQYDVFSVSGSSYADGATVKSSTNLKNFTVVDNSGVAALGGSLGRFYFSQDLASFTSYSLPFPGKTVLMQAGSGGDANGKGAGGAGGAIKGINIEASEATLLSGDGGNSLTGAAGAGGGISNAASMITSSGVTVVPGVIASEILLVESGNGGSAVSNGSGASGGAGGSISGMTLNLLAGADLTVPNQIDVTTGNGGNGHGGVGGNGGTISALKTSTANGNVSVTLGNGGNALGGTKKGGDGGSMNGYTHALSVSVTDPAAELENSYTFEFTAGSGGNSAGGTGGSGGSLANFNLTLNPANSHDSYSNLPDPDTGLDNTVRVLLTAGDSGSGATGGLGGGISNIKETTALDQMEGGYIFLNPVVMEMHAGSGGAGTFKAGGNGGSVNVGPGNLSGLTFYDPISPNAADPGLVITAGDGGAGATVGGVGGSILGLKSNNTIGPNNVLVRVNMLTGAFLEAGTGGAGTTAGGRGGDVNGFSISTQTYFHGFGLEVDSGDGGASAGGKAGAGGNILNGTVGLVSGRTMLFDAGNGGTGKLSGGAGGAISSIDINIPQQNNLYAAQFYGGAGGDATNPLAKAGNGGDVTGITNLKDVNSAIAVIQAGNGGSNLAGTGGSGGNVKQINTVGFIGNPTDGLSSLGVFNYGLAQGIFVGRGGAGATAGSAGSVLNVSARQISAIAAAVDGNGLFGLASSISGITADLIGYDATTGTPNVYDDSQGTHLSPTQVVALDGFMLAKAITNINTFNNNRTAQFEFTS